MTTPTNIVTLAETKAYLNIEGTEDDTELLAFIDAATVKITELAGPVLPTTVTEYHNGGRETITLLERPVASITSVTEVIGDISTALTAVTFGAGTSNYGYSFDADWCAVTRRVGNWPATFADGVGNIRVVYVAGYAAIPAQIALATKALIGHWWQASQQNRMGGRPGFSGEEYQQALGGGYAVPNFVRQMLPQRDNVSGIA